MCTVIEQIAELHSLGIPPKGIDVLCRLFAGTGELLVDSSSSYYCVRPRLAAKMIDAGLIISRKYGGRSVVRLTDKGSDVAFDLFG